MMGQVLPFYDKSRNILQTCHDVCVDVICLVIQGDAQSNEKKRVTENECTKGHDGPAGDTELIAGCEANMTARQLFNEQLHLVELLAGLLT